jgi:dTDP-4-amino-4,6-dideoxygalactose transaminase
MGNIYGIGREPVNDCYLAIGEVIKSREFILGAAVAKLERKLANFVGRGSAVAVSSGTDAQFLLMKALGIGPGDLVYVPDFTFMSTATTVKMVGARPIFVDVNLDTFTMNPGSLENKIRESAVCGTPKAVVPVDLFGCPYNYVEINRIAKDYGLVVIEDGCHAMGSQVGNLQALRIGDHSFTSFYPTKPLGCFGDAGMIFTDDTDLAHDLRFMRKHNQKMKNNCDSLGYNMRMDTIQAVVLLEKFKRYPEELERRRRIARMYVDGLDSEIGVQNQPGRSSCALFSLVVSQRFREELKGVDYDIYYRYPLHKLKVFKEDLISYDYPNSTALCQSIFQIPMHPYLSDKEVYHIIDVINKAYEGGGSK